MPLQQPEWVLRDVGQVSAGLPLLESGGLIFQVKGRNTVSGDFKGIVYSFTGIDQYDVFRESAFNQQNSVFGEWRLSFFGDVFQLGWAEVGVSKGIFGFSVDLLGNNQADLYVQEGAMLPGSNGASISSFEEFFAFDDGTVGFKVRLSDNKLGVWRDSVGTLNQKIILAGDPLPGIPPASNFGFISNLAANTEGYVAFMDQFVDGPNFFSGLWVANVAGIEPVCVGGETIEVEPGVTKTVNDVLSGQFSGTRTGADGHPTTLNLDGAVPFRVQFIEGGYALMLGKPSSIVVNSTGDDPDIDPNDGFCYTGTILPDGSLECTMRAAIMESNARGDNETITFDIPETPTIQPASCLPLITDSVLIDGTTQPGPDPVILDGVNAGDCNGLTVLTNECTIKGLSIGRFGLNGISVVGDDGLSGDESVKVFGCRLGFETDMGATFGNNLDGIQISATVNTQVGGPAAGEGNVITHNSRNGVDIDGSEDTRVIGNTIGSNEGDGVIIDEASLNSVLDLNHIGVSEGGDLIGNSGWGISVHGQSNDAVVGSAPTPPSAVASRLIPPAGNRVSHNLEGGVFVANSNRPDIRDNQFTGNVGPGIEFDSTTTFGVISSNVISGNLSSGVVIRNSDEVTIEKNLIGLDSVGSGAMGNGHDGVLITDATGATISDNYIAANSRNGVTLDSGSTFCAVRRNKVGVTPLNTSAGNDESGVHIMNQSNVNSVGDVFGGNVISNNRRGVSVHNSSLITIDKNLIGLDTTGVNPMGDFFGDGIRIINSSSNDITDNYVTNSTFHGILVDSGSNTNTLTNNKVGLNKTGNSAGNPIGILIANGSENNIIGGGHQKGNVISANTTFGLQIKNSDKTLIQGNIIGLDTTGTVSMGNGEDGIRISNSLQTTVGVGVDQFGVLTGDGNVVSGNDSTGIRLENSDFTTIYSNIIGAAIDTVTELPNSWGIWIFGESETFIGGLDGAQPTLGNFVVGNRSTGIGIESNLCDISGNTIANNGYVLIPGQSETGGNGVYLKGESNRVGMTNPLFKNTIRNNNGAGVYVDFEFRGMDQRNTIRFNSIYDNTNGGIDVAPFGPNPNDSLDIDDGPNAGQNKPQLNVAEITGSGQLFVAGNLSSEPNKRYAIDFYSNDVCDPAGLGQGKDWLFSDTVVTGSDGLAKFISLASPTAPLAGLSLTATATAIIEDGFGVFSAHTSEFSNCLAMIPQEPGVDIHVEKTDNLLETTTSDT
ncbi:MAG: right-handed parallel beta-helix repeat-containing protein, partial [bacterium]